ncbi:uncharacterized protein [Aegilops tauschii subsp. strangulata]|uniref:uncharacterized protein n=1 Tax=Aegilops tauschii subsp. strangulata TaxID=200361 RepID=UPI00098B8B31
MSDISAASDLGTMPAAGLGALDAASSGDASSPAPLSIHNVDILTHVPAKLDFDADNYAEWRDGMLSALAEFGASDHVEEQGHSLHEGDEEWMRADVTIVLWIYTTISDELLDEVMAAHSTAFEVWAQLRGFFENEHVFDPAEELRTAAQGAMSINAYGWRLKALARAVADAGGEPVSDTALVLQLLRGVTPRLRVMGTSLLVNDRFPSFMEALSWLHLEEYRREQGEF